MTLSPEVSARSFLFRIRVFRLPSLRSITACFCVTGHRRHTVADSARHGRPTSLWQRVTPLLWAGSWTAHVTITKSGSPNLQTYCVNFTSYIMYKHGRVPHHATCGPWVSNPWSSYSKEVCRDLKQQVFKVASIYLYPSIFLRLKIQLPQNQFPKFVTLDHIPTSTFLQFQS
jgi:hypothetical protein